jgi:CHAT domain-containing protein
LFPAERCAQDAQTARGLRALANTQEEVQRAQRLTGAGNEAVRLGAAFTADAVRSMGLERFRIVHLATHALLPGELSCLTEPSIVMSTPGGAASAEKGFLKASEVLGLKLDADLVVLSACNTGGAGGEGGGEALSGLARSFFYAGARGLLVTHWSVDDYASLLTVILTLQGQQGVAQQGGLASADALRRAQLTMIDTAGRTPSIPAAYSHPYYWAPFALIGDGRRSEAPLRTAAAPRGSRS